MAQKVVTTITDDIDAAQGLETEADETIRFGVEGRNYEIDLSKENATTLRENLGFYTQYAREVGGRPSARTRRDRARPKAIRDWAKQQGLTVTERGRIPQSVQAQYDAVH